MVLFVFLLSCCNTQGSNNKRSDESSCFYVLSLCDHSKIECWVCFNCLWISLWRKETLCEMLLDTLAVVLFVFLLSCCHTQSLNNNILSKRGASRFCPYATEMWHSRRGRSAAQHNKWNLKVHTHIQMQPAKHIYGNLATIESHICCDSSFHMQHSASKTSRNSFHDGPFLL